MTGYAPESDPSDAPLFAGSGTLEEAIHELFSVVTEVSITHLAFTIIAVFITFFGLFSGFIKERLYIGEAIIATLCGIAFSGYAAGIFAPKTWAGGHEFDEITLEVTRVIIALSVFAVGVELPKAYVKRHWKSLLFLLGPVMFAGWMVSAALMYAIIPGLEFLPALVVAAGVTPTDPILASSVVGKGKFAQEHVPAHIRHILQAESGCNDGAAFPFLYLALFILLRGHHSVGQAVGYWILLCILYQIVLGVIIGTVVGICARKLMKFSKRRALIDRESMVAMYVALALLVTGATTLCGSDDLLAAFCCGTAFAWDDWFTESIEESNFSSTIDLLANCTVFLYLGATMPFHSWNDSQLTLTPWRLVLLALGILALRRLPSIYFLQWWIPDIKTRREAIFAGHFGPMGVGAIFISTLALSKLPTPTLPPETSLDRLSLIIQPVTYFIVLSSILIHGLTISFFSLGRTVHSRVTSISRTFTTNTTRNGTTGISEPSWLSRVKRAHEGEEIVINRDDDVSAEKALETVLALEEEAGGEKGDLDLEANVPALEERDDEDLTESELSTSEEERIDKLGPQAVRAEAKRREEARRRKEHELEYDENPPKNVLGPRESRTRTGSRSRRSSSPRKSVEVVIDRPGEETSATGPPPIPSWARPHLERTSDDRQRSLEEKKKMFGRGRGQSISHAIKAKLLGDNNPEKAVASSAVLSPAKEAHYCTPDRTSFWREGNRLVIDREDGEDVEVIELDDDHIEREDLREALKTWKESQTHYTITKKDIEDQKRRDGEAGDGSRMREESDMSVMKRILKQMVLRDSNTSPEERAEKERKQREKDALCQLEQRYSSKDNSAIIRRARETRQEDSPVRDGTFEVLSHLEGDEREAALRKYAKALYYLGVDKSKLKELIGREGGGRRGSAIEEGARGGSSGTRDGSTGRAGRDENRSQGIHTGRPPVEGVPEQSHTGESSRGRPLPASKPSATRTRSPAPRTVEEDPSNEEEEDEEDEPKPFVSSGIPLTRSERIEVDSEGDESDGEASSGTRELHPRKTTGGMLSTVTGLLKGKQTSPQRPTVSGPFSPSDDSPSAGGGNSNTIRFANVSRPARENATGGGRSFPVVGAGLNTRRKPSKGE